jgi:hypothetical protein
MFDLAFHELREYVIDRVKDASLVKKTTSVALGISLSRSIDLPSSEVNYAESHYNDQVSSVVAQTAAMFNEQFIVDMDLVCQTARSFWLIRYYNAYPCSVIPLPQDNEGHFMSAIVGVGHLINPNTFEFCQKNSRAMIAIVNRVREITDKFSGK